MIALALVALGSIAGAIPVHHVVITRQAAPRLDDDWVQIIKAIGDLEGHEQGVEGVLELPPTVPLVAAADRTNVIDLVFNLARVHAADDLTLDLVIDGHGNQDGFVADGGGFTPYATFALALKRVMNAPRVGPLRLRVYTEVCFAGRLARLFRRSSHEVLFVTTAAKTDVYTGSLRRTLRQTLQVMASARELHVPLLADDFAREFEFSFNAIGRLGFRESGDPSHARLIGAGPPRDERLPEYVRNLTLLYRALQTEAHDGATLNSIRVAIDQVLSHPANVAIRRHLERLRTTDDSEVVRRAANLFQMRAHLESVPRRERTDRIRRAFDDPDRVNRFAALDVLLTYRDDLPHAERTIGEFYWDEVARPDPSPAIRSRIYRELRPAPSKSARRVCEHHLTNP